MSNIQTGAERMPHDLSHLGFLAGQIGRLITISTTPVIAGDSFEMDAVGALRLSPLRRGLAIDSTVDIFTLVLILLLMPTLNFLPVWFALSLLRFRLPSRLPMMFILWMVAMMVVIIPSRTV